MASVNSRSELYPNRAFTPPDSVFEMDDDHDPEFQARMPLRHGSSYENMNGQVFTDDTHHYEDPSRLKAQILHSSSRRGPIPEPSKSSKTSNKRPRKKINETYEPVGTKERKRTLTDESYSTDVYHRDRCSTLFKILALVGFFVALAALALVIMITLGLVSLPACQDCKKEIVPEKVPSSSVEATGSVQELWEVIKELRVNVSRLTWAVQKKDEMISQLQKRDLDHTIKIAELERKASHRLYVSNNTELNISGLAGPRGPPGFRGPAGAKGEDGRDGKPGKTGSGNMTLCRYIKKTSVKYTADAYGNGQNVIVREPRRERIVGVTCSTLGSSESNLITELMADNVIQYVCECRGLSIVFTASRGNAQCIMHYWICPLIS